MKIPAIAQIIVDKLKELDGEKYNLLAYCIMPNHVHILIDTSVQLSKKTSDLKPEDLINYYQLDKIMQLIKGSTAFTANRFLRRKGTF